MRKGGFPGKSCCPRQKTGLNWKSEEEHFGQPTMAIDGLAVLPDGQ